MLFGERLIYIPPLYSSTKFIEILPYKGIEVVLQHSTLLEHRNRLLQVSIEHPPFAGVSFYTYRFLISNLIHFPIILLLWLRRARLWYLVPFFSHIYRYIYRCSSRGYGWPWLGLCSWNPKSDAFVWTIRYGANCGIGIDLSNKGTDTYTPANSASTPHFIHRHLPYLVIVWSRSRARFFT